MDKSPGFVLISDHCQHCQATATILKFLELPLQIIDNEQTIPPALFNSTQAFIICGFLTENVWQTYWQELATKASATSLIFIGKQIQQNFTNRHIETLSLPLTKTTLQQILNRSQIWQASESLEKGLDLKNYIAQTEIRLITEALQQCNGVISHAAKFLNMGRTTLIEKMRKHGIKFSKTAQSKKELAI